MDGDQYQYNRSYKAILDTYQMAFMKHARRNGPNRCVIMWVTSDLLLVCAWVWELLSMQEQGVRID